MSLPSADLDIVNCEKALSLLTTYAKRFLPLVKKVHRKRKVECFTTWMYDPKQDRKCSLWWHRKLEKWAKEGRIAEDGHLKVVDRPIRKFQSKTIKKIFPHLSLSEARIICAHLYGTYYYRRTK